VLTPREAESDFNNDQLTAIRAYFTRRLRRGERSIDAHFQYLPFDQEPPIPVHADNVLVVIKECRAAGWEVELERGKWEFKTPESKASSDEAHKLCDTCHGCGGKLLTTDSSVGCYTVGCRRTMKVPVSEAVAYPAHPYYGPCPSAIAMRHG